MSNNRQTKKYIDIRGASEHNLKSIDLKLPRDKFIVVTGVSGSGKSSLAFDTIYSEGQRRYVESLSSYARQFLGQNKKPDVDSITGIPPAVAIQQKGPGYNPRSTVGTLTEIYDYLRLLFARIGRVHCPKCGRKIESQSIDEIIEQIVKKREGSKTTVIAPVVRGRKGKYKELFQRLRREGFVKVRIDGSNYSLEEEIDLDGRKNHKIGVIIDRLKITGSESNEERLTDSVEIAMKKTEGTVEIESENGNKLEKEVFSSHYACPVCEISLGEMEPRNFSFNSPYGACEECSGLGVKLEVDPELVVLDDKLTINQGAIEPWSDPITNRRHRWKKSARKYRTQMIVTLSKELGFSLDTPFKKLPEKIQNILLFGSDREFVFNLQRGGRRYTKKSRFEGAVEVLTRRHLQTDSDYVRKKIQEKYMREARCPVCKGTRLKKESLAVTVDGKNIAELVKLPVKKLVKFFDNIKLSGFEKTVGEKILEELTSRTRFLVDVGVDYISLDRKANTLSSGENERIRLATQIGSSLVGVAYILDEPTVGLHARDTKRLLKSLKSLQEIGNTVLVVEHDSQTIEIADYVLDLGPAAGVHGGRVVFSGKKSKFTDCSESLTSRYFTGEEKVPLPQKRRSPGKKNIKLEGCRQFNLKNIDVEFKAGLFNCVTGVSGSGKSTLVEEILYKAMKRKLYSNSDVRPGSFDNLQDSENFEKVINIDQTPIGRTPRSNPATYTKVFTPIRELFAGLPLSKVRGYEKGRFSFNVKEGTCSKCKGQGQIKLEMQFLPDVYVPCEVCNGRKYTEGTLEVKYKGKNIYEVLEMTVEEALEFFSNFNRVTKILKTLKDVGLGYIKLGQPSTTLSGGEAQRIKLARELAKRSRGDTLYILDEPTTGLHPDDIKYLLSVLHSLVDKGNTVVLIEHNMDVIKNADWIVDLGPEGGEDGGEVVVCGKPAKLIKSKDSYTGEFLKKYMKKH
ncbi:MAG: excinuclease ABC subunit UvrA [Elusimicrobiota bacterium]